MDELLALDQRLLLALNGSDSIFWDNVMCTITRTTTWIPLALVLLYVVARNVNMRQMLVFVLMVAILVLITDRVSSGVVKPLVHRFRPTHEPVLDGLVDVCRGYRGGLYGFFSSHAANTFGLCTFVSLVLRHWRSTVALVSWAALSSYSRIYLGVHYPGDILCGMLFGIAVGWGLFLLYRYLLTLLNLPPRHFDSSRYTSTGFFSKDCEWIPIAFVGTLVVVAICALW